MNILPIESVNMNKKGKTLGYLTRLFPAPKKRPPVVLDLLLSLDTNLDNKRSISRSPAFTKALVSSNHRSFLTQITSHTLTLSALDISAFPDFDAEWCSQDASARSS